MASNIVNVPFVTYADGSKISKNSVRKDYNNQVERLETTSADGVTHREAEDAVSCQCCDDRRAK